MNGFAGKIARIDLTARSVTEEPLDPEVARKYEGGRAFGAKVLLEELKSEIDPLGPENKLIFAGGPTTGTVMPGQTRYVVIGKSPLTGLYGEAGGGGSFMTNVKRAGFDALIIEGKADSPVYVWVHDGQVEIRDASHLWGKLVADTDDTLREEVGDVNARVACIGPAGEKLVRFACVIAEKHKAAGRCGLGAVMGSKNLKAVVARGTGTVPVADPAKLRGIIREMAAAAREDPGQQGLGTYGTSGGIPTLQSQGILPTQNFQKGTFEGSDRISGQRLAETILTRCTSCEGCYITHYREVTVDESPYGRVDPKYSGAEYETVAAFGSQCLIDDLVAINVANQVCNSYGVDTISAGVVMAWAMECAEKEILTPLDMDGLSLKWGDAGAMLTLLEKTCKREGIGDVLAEGVKRASERIGKGSEALAMHVRGQELAMHEPRGKKGLALGYTAAGPRGGSHMEFSHDPSFERENAIPEVGLVKPLSRFAVEGKGELAYKASAIRSLVNDLGLCVMVVEPSMGRSSLTQMAQIVSAITGWDVTVSELMEMGERANILARAFNVREGVRRSDDYLPERFSEPMKEGASAGETVTREDMDVMLDEFYAVSGWTPDGIPTRERLAHLGVEWAAELIGA